MCQSPSLCSVKVLWAKNSIQLVPSSHARGVATSDSGIVPKEECSHRWTNSKEHDSVLKSKLRGESFQMFSAGMTLLGYFYLKLSLIPAGTIRFKEGLSMLPEPWEQMPCLAHHVTQKGGGRHLSLLLPMILDNGRVWSPFLERVFQESSDCHDDAGESLLVCRNQRCCKNPGSVG